MLQLRLKNIIDDIFLQLIKPLGYHRSNFVFHRNMNDVVHIIDVQIDRKTFANRLEFTINAGIYLPGFWKTYYANPLKDQMIIPKCCVNVRVGMLDAQRLDKWWEIQVNDDSTTVDALIAKEINNNVSALVLPFLSHFQNISDVLRFLSEKRRTNMKYVWPKDYAKSLTYAATVASMVGDNGIANDLLTKAQENSKSPIFKNEICQLRTRLLK